VLIVGIVEGLCIIYNIEEIGENLGIELPREGRIEKSLQFVMVILLLNMKLISIAENTQKLPNIGLNSYKLRATISNDWGHPNGVFSLGILSSLYNSGISILLLRHSIDIAI